MYLSLSDREIDTDTKFGYPKPVSFLPALWSCQVTLLAHIAPSSVYLLTHQMYKAEIIRDCKLQEERG